MKAAISKQIKNIFESGELSRESVVSKMETTAAIAKAFVENEFEKFRELQDRTHQSDFDRLMADAGLEQE